MQVQQVEAFEGVRWMRQGFRCFMTQPLSVGALFFVCLTTSALLGALPGVGRLLQYGFLPFMIVGMMNMSRVILSGNPAWPHVLIEPLRASPGAFVRMVNLALVFALLLSVAYFFVTMDNKGELFGKFSEGVLKGTPTEQDKQVLIAGTQRASYFMALVLIVQLLFWFAPALIAWHGFGLAKAIFGSLYALKRNWAAFVVYVFTWIGVYFLVINLAALLIITVASQQVLGVWLMPVAMVLVSAQSASLYASYDSVFVGKSPNEI
jgi:hypothetical protein